MNGCRVDLERAVEAQLAVASGLQSSSNRRPSAAMDWNASTHNGIQRANMVGVLVRNDHATQLFPGDPKQFHAGGDRANADAAINEEIAPFCRNQQGIS